MPTKSAGSIPQTVQMRVERRLLDCAKRHPAQFRISVRFQGAFCYVDAYEPSGEAGEQTLTHLFRIRYLGSEDLWSFAFYTYAQEKYEPSFLMTGDKQGTPEEAFETSTLFY